MPFCWFCHEAANTFVCDLQKSAHRFPPIIAEQLKLIQIICMYHSRLEVTTQDSVTPSFTVSSALRSGSQTGTEVYSGIVGDQLYWTIDIPCKSFSSMAELVQFETRHENIFYGICEQRRRPACASTQSYQWDPIVSVPDHCLSFYFTYQRLSCSLPRLNRHM